MAKSYGTRKKSSFSQKKQNLREMEELEESGLMDLLSNRQRLYSKNVINFESDDLWSNLTIWDT